MSIYSCNINFGIKSIHTNETTQVSLGPLAADAAHELHVLREDGDAFAMNSTEVSIFEQTGEISLGGSLAGHYSMRLEAQISFEILRYLRLRALCDCVY